MNRRAFLSTTAIAPIALVPVLTPAARPQEGDTTTDIIFHEVTAALRARLPPDFWLHSDMFSSLDHPGILRIGRFVVSLGDVHWARPAILNFRYYVHGRDTEIVHGAEIMDLSQLHRRPWGDSDPADLLGRWRMVLNDAADAILARARGMFV